MNPAVQALLTIVIGVGGCVGYFYLSNLFLDKVLFPIKGPNIGRNITRANMIRPWLFLMPALVALGLYLAYPVFATAWLSIHRQIGGGQSEFVGFANYSQMFTESKFWESMKNNMIWLIVVPALSTAFGVLAAQLTDRIWWGNIAKSLIFMPMAISFVGASVIWKLIYDTRPIDQAQIGLLNAVWLQLGGGFWSVLVVKILPALTIAGLVLSIVWGLWLIGRPLLQGAGGPAIAKLGRIVAVIIGAWLVYTLMTWFFGIFAAELPYGKEQTWLTIPFWNNFFLMIVLVWIQTGFAMVIISGALRGVPEETIEAAILDGASPFQVFFQIKIPQIMGTIVVVWTTITITVLKVFDIVLAMTNGQWETQVLANYMFDKLFRANDWGVGSASAMIIMLLVMPILVWNVYNARKEMR
jgi:alpha-glucoside transport system permease protein